MTRSGPAEKPLEAARSEAQISKNHAQRYAMPCVAARSEYDYQKNPYIRIMHLKNC
jgi:hypothetical protein